MATKTVTDQSFASDVLGAEGPVLVDFWAEWCGPCRMIAPALEEIAGELGDKVTVAKLNIDENPDTPGRYGVRGIPTMLLFKGGQPIAQKVGAAPRSQIQQWLESNLDAAAAVERRLADSRGRLGASEPPRIRPEFFVPRQVVVRLEPADPASPENVKAGRDCFGLVERDDAEIDGLRLMIDLHQERASRIRRKIRGGRSSTRARTAHLSAPLVQAKSPSATLAKTIAGAPLLSWQVRQWHQPQSNGSLFSS